MFTGIIKTTGRIIDIKRHQITIGAGQLIKELKKGSSIAVDGICLTVSKKSGLPAGQAGKQFVADVMPETIKKTNLAFMKPCDLVNLELALKAGDRFEGHFVTGHVEGLGKIQSIKRDKNAYLLTIGIPDDLKKYVIPKGSIAINGISLTLIDIKKNVVTVGIIPHTFKVTNCHALKPGDKVNIETDLMAKYLEQWQK